MSISAGSQSRTRPISLHDVVRHFYFNIILQTRPINEQTNRSALKKLTDLLKVGIFFPFILALQPPPLPLGQGFLIHEVSRSHNDAPKSVGLLWTWDQLVAVNLYLTTHSTYKGETSMPPGGIRTHNFSRRAAADLRLRLRGHWDRHILPLQNPKINQ